MKPFLLGAASSIAVVLIAGYLFLALGGLPMAAKSPPLPFEERIAAIALNAALKGEADKVASIPADDAHLSEGAKLYAHHCAVCHGSPHIDQSAISKGLFPEPPYFFPPEAGLVNEPEGEIFWIVKNGIRLTAMPGFGDNLSDEQIWDVSLFLKNANQLSESVQKAFADHSKLHQGN